MIASFRSFLVLSLFLGVVFTLGSCTVQKRRYRDGFYIEYAGKHSPEKKSAAETTEKQVAATLPETEVINTPAPETQSQPGKTAASTVEEKQQIAKHKTSVPDTFIVEEAKKAPQTNSERIKYLLKNNQDINGAAIVKEAETANWLMIGGLVSLFIIGIGPLLALASLIFLLIAQSKLNSAYEGQYSPDNHLLIRRTFWPALITFLLPFLIFALIFILIF
jgi:uncharacterized membrane protein